MVERSPERGFSGGRAATLSNCGNVLKALLPSSCGNTSVARVMTSGMVTTQSMSHFGEMDNPQPSPKANDFGYGCSSQTKW